MVQNEEYTYDITTAMQIRYTVYYYNDELFPHIRRFQERNWQNSNVKQHSRLLPLDFQEFDYFDKKFMEWYLCEHTSIQYFEKFKIGALSKDYEVYKMKFNCYASWFSTTFKKKIRMHYSLDMRPGAQKMEFDENNPETDAQVIRVKSTEEELSKVSFIRGVRFR